MAKKGFGLQTIPAEDETDLMLKEYHQHWRKTNSNSNTSFVPIFNGFREKHLASLEPGPLRLYLFFAFAANNQFGHSWHSVQSIAEFFGTQTRTIDNWIKSLVDAKLIYREHKGKKSRTTYLIPYSDTLIKHQLNKDVKKDDQEVLDRFLDKINKREFLYGPIIGVYHFYQWRANKKNKPVIDSNIQWLVILTKRNDDVLTCHYYQLNNSEVYGVDELEIEDIATFESPYQYNGSDITGVALNHENKLGSSNTDIIMNFIRRVSNQEKWDWNDYPTTDYGKIEHFFTEEDED